MLVGGLVWRDHNLFTQAKAIQRSTWLRHMLPAADGFSDPDGISVRPVKGLSGVSYLQDGLMSAATWVFGPTIHWLQDKGYNQTTLRAAPYDFRIPVSKLEERDQYFSRLVEMVETLYESSGNKPVVLLGHSMGCKIIHYFSWWVARNPPLHSPTLRSGKSWLHKYLHALLPIGGPVRTLRRVVTPPTPPPTATGSVDFSLLERLCRL